MGKFFRLREADSVNIDTAAINITFAVSDSDTRSANDN